MATQISFGGTTLQFPSPDFDNQEKYELDRIKRESRGGDPIVFRDSEWTHVTTLVYRFSYLTQKKVRDLISLIEASLGKNVTIVDFEGTTWTGIITTPAAQVAQPGRFNFTAEFEFQGVKS